MLQTKEDPGYITWDDPASDDDPTVGWDDLGNDGWDDTVADTTPSDER